MTGRLEDSLASGIRMDKMVVAAAATEVAEKAAAAAPDLMQAIFTGLGSTSRHLGLARPPSAIESRVESCRVV